MLDTKKFKEAHNGNKYCKPFSDNRSYLQAMFEQQPKVYNEVVRDIDPLFDVDNLDLLHSYEELSSRYGRTVREIRDLLQAAYNIVFWHIQESYVNIGGYPKVPVDMIDKLPTRACMAFRRVGITQDYKLKRWLDSPYKIDGLGPTTYDELRNLFQEYNLPKYNHLQPRNSARWLRENYMQLDEITDMTKEELILVRSELFSRETYVYDHLPADLQKAMKKHGLVLDVQILRRVESGTIIEICNQPMYDLLRRLCVEKYKYVA